MSESSGLAASMDNAVELLLRYVAGFDDSNATAQAPNLPNHVAWSLGHLALTMHRAAGKIAGNETAPPWDPEPFAFGSAPKPSQGDYPRLGELIQRYRSAHAALSAAVRAAGDTGLDRQVVWSGTTTLACRDLALRMIFHNGTHCGQIVDLRRALGMPQVIVPPARPSPSAAAPR